MGHQTQTWNCKFCGKLYVWNRKYKYCDCMEEQVIIGIDKRSYIHPKEMQFISYLLNSKTEFSREQREWYKSKVLTRLNILQPLVNECNNKGLSFAVISSELNNEYNDLIFIKNKNCIE